MPLLLTQLAAVLLGLLTGAMLLIGVALVPYWSSLEPLEFSAWFAANVELIRRLMVPLGGLATLSVVLAATLAAVRRLPSWSWLAVAALSALFVAASYPLYYANANAALVSGTLEPSEISALLGRWRFWHWVRTVAGAVAFLATIRACSPRAQSTAA